MTSPFSHELDFKEISEVNVVPLADVSLCLLIILMVISPMMTQEMLRVQAAAEAKEDLPVRDPSQIPAPPAPPEMVLVVSLRPNGLAVGDRQFEGLGEVMSFISDALSRRADKKVFVAPHPDVPNGRVVHMLEILKACGASSVALVQSRPEADPKP